MMAAGRCTVSTRDLFLLIIFIATLSLLFNYQISYYGNVMEDQRIVKTELYDVPVGTSLSADDEVKFVLGRSLSQHASEVSRSLQLNGESNPRQKLLQRLQKLEEHSLKDTERGGIVFNGFTSPEREDIRKVHGTRNSVIQQIGGLSWVEDDTSVQGNWSVMVCKGDCPDQRGNTRTKINRIPDLKPILNSSNITCAITKRLQQNSENSNNKCQPFSCDDYSFNEDVLLSLGNKNYINNSFEHLCRSSSNLDLSMSTIWRLTPDGIIYPGGPVIRLNVLFTSFPMLRLYSHPIMYTGSYMALQDVQFFKKTFLDDLLQMISDNYGLGTSTRWWREIQTTLFLYFVQTQLFIQTENIQNRCKNCHQLLQVDIVCPSVQYCHIIQVSSNWTYELSVLDRVLLLVTYKTTVTFEVLQTLENINHQNIKEICDKEKNRNELCYNEDFLYYLLQWRHEIKQKTEWIPIYPTLMTCRELKSQRIKHLIEDSSIVRYNDMLSMFGDSIHWSEDNNTELQYASDGNIDYAENDSTRIERSTQGSPRLCSNDDDKFGEIRDIFTQPDINLTKTSTNMYNTTVDYDTILIRLWVTSANCRCQVKLENKYNDPGPRNITLGLGENRIMIYVVEEVNNVYNIVNTYTINIIRKYHGLNGTSDSEHRLVTCGLKQDCTSRYDYSKPCGLTEHRSTWQDVSSKQQCTSGDHDGQWVVPCRSCSDENSCYWQKATWQPYKCQYTHFPPSTLKSCLNGKKILFIGDSTNRGVSNYITEQINGSLYDLDKTHSTKVYTNVNYNLTQISFAYYPHFWLPLHHRPKFSKVIYQLIKSSLPLENNSNTILVVGGVHWLAKQHIDLITEALARKGLSGITKIVKGLGAGFHQKVEDVRYVPETEQSIFQQRETEILNYARNKDFHTVATFNMTISRYKDFLEGKCACHFHKLTKKRDIDGHLSYTVEGNINEAYSQILLNQICL
ncbi:Cadherin-like and PC-esterase [Mactra antiquata]